MVISASTSFLTRTHGHTHGRTPGKPVYRGETGSPKKVKRSLGFLVGESVKMCKKVISRLSHGGMCKSF